MNFATTAKPTAVFAAMDSGVIGVIVVGIIVLGLAIVILGFFSIWIRALFANARVSLWQLFGMKIRRVPATLVVDARITAIKAGLEISTDALEAHYLAGGNIVHLVQALIAADKAGIPLEWKRACAIDLSTRGTNKSILEAVLTSVNPKVIDCPNPKSGRSTIDAVAKDGIQVKVKARVTVRTSLSRFIGGAQEETIIARVGEGIVTTIGSSDSYKAVLENPDRISKTVLARGLDVGSAFDILSIDIADVDVGDNIGAQLQAAQAEANKNMAQAQAEIRRAAAVAVEQEMKAKVQEMRALVVEAESKVPLALAEALRTGKMGFMDFYRLENLKSDTQMRHNIGLGDEPAKK